MMLKTATPPVEQERASRPQRIVYPDSPRYRRIRTLSTLMDQCIVLPTGYRIGLDPLLGLLPGIGDVLSALISCYLVYEAARLGLKKRVLARMLGNIGIDTLVGSFPLLGDIFDAAWKSNMRNLRLIDQHYHPAMPERSAGQIRVWVLVVGGLMLAAAGLVAYVSAQLVLAIAAAVWHLFRP
jgi:hypothetical protein